MGNASLPIHAPFIIGKSWEMIQLAIHGPFSSPIHWQFYSLPIHWQSSWPIQGPVYCHCPFMGLGACAIARSIEILGSGLGMRRPESVSGSISTFKGWAREKDSSWQSSVSSYSSTESEDLVNLEGVGLECTEESASHSESWRSLTRSTMGVILGNNGEEETRVFVGEGVELWDAQ